MAVLFGANTAPRGLTPVGQMDGSQQGGNVRVYREVITLTGQTTADTIVIAYPSKGESFLKGVVTASVSLGTNRRIDSPRSYFRAGASYMFGNNLRGAGLRVGYWF